MTTGLLNIAFTRARMTLVAFAVVLLGGIQAYMTIPREAEPDVQIPLLYVSMSLEGISPEDAESLLIEPMENELNNIEGVKEIRSTAYEGGGFVMLEFHAGFDIDQALADVRASMDDARSELPQDAEEPKVHEVNVALFPVLSIALSGDVPERILMKLADNVADSIKQLASVLKVERQGYRKEQVEVIVAPEKLEAYDLNLADILRRIDRNHSLVAAGALEDGPGRFSVKIPGLIKASDELRSIPIAKRSGTILHLGDVADIRRTFKDRAEYARLNRKPAIILDISKRLGSNIITMIDDVKTVVASEQANWPAGVHITYARDQSREIRDRISDLTNNIMSAIFVVIIVMIAVLGPVAAGLVGLTVPSSFLCAILVLHIMGLTINIVVLFSLILAVGILVDGAIVVSETAERHLSQGDPPQIAYRDAAARMFWPITTSTATTLAAFFPLLFWPGTTGAFMQYLPITVFAVLISSLGMALVFIPVLGGTLRRAQPYPFQEGPSGGKIATFYSHLLSRILMKPGRLILFALSILILAQASYVLWGRGVEFFPDTEPDQATIRLFARGNFSVEKANDLLRLVEQEVTTLARTQKEIRYVHAVAHAAKSDQDMPDKIGDIHIGFADWRMRRPAEAIFTEIRDRTSTIAGIKIEITSPNVGPPIDKPIHIRLSSPYLDLLTRETQKLRDVFETMPSLMDIEDDLPSSSFEWRLNIDREQAALYGTDIDSVGMIVKFLTRGVKISDYRPSDSDEEIDIIARFPQLDRNLDRLDSLRVRGSQGWVPLSSFITRYPAPEVTNIKRSDGQRVMSIKANVQPGILVEDALRDITAGIQTLNIDPRVTINFKGEREEQDNAASFLTQAFLIALGLITIILISQFNRFYDAFLILSAVIMSTIGVMLGLLLTHQPFGIIMCGIGVIALAGIVVNHNIVLIDTFRRLRRQEPDIMRAALLAATERLRPILLTTATTIFGLLPMALGMTVDFINREVSFGSPSAQIWKQLAVTIVFGLAFATPLTLTVTPAALVLPEVLRQKISKISARFSRSQASS